MNKSIEIRPGTMEDIEEILCLERSVPEAPHWSRSEYEAIFRQNEDQSHIRRCLFVAVRNDRVPHPEVATTTEGWERTTLAGFAVAKVVPTAEYAELESIAVCAGMRRLRVGTRLCRAVIEWCRVRGIISVELEVRSASISAIELYKSIGFFAQGIRKAYYRNPDDDAVLMRLDLK